MQWHAKAQINAGENFYVVGRDPTAMSHQIEKRDLHHCRIELKKSGLQVKNWVIWTLGSIVFILLNLRSTISISWTLGSKMDGVSALEQLVNEKMRPTTNYASYSFREAYRPQGCNTPFLHLMLVAILELVRDKTRALNSEIWFRKDQYHMDNSNIL